MAAEESSEVIPRQSIWSVGVRQVVYMAVGIALYAILSIIFNLVQLPNAAGGAVSLRPGIVIPLFFGVVFGPVVGLFVGGIGNILGDLISYHNFYWNWDLGNALIGFIAGFVVLFTRGRYRTTRAIVYAEIASAIAIIIGIAFAAFNDIWVSQNSVAAATSEFFVATIPDLINGLILLPIVIVAYNSAVRSRGRG
ncbi:MAG TPA: ECF transporter S component [Ktedonobacteraceae bacterium]|jgi:energy-coupling factor transport system substrate-specific component|nr:ECF transporter S component [Ktedonobacteraceae bacterium]